MAIASREDLKQYCLRRLGAPVIQINVDDQQLEDRMDDAFQYYQDYHYDATEKHYWVYTLTSTDISNRYIKLGNGADIPTPIGITRIFPLNETLTQNNMFDLRYQMRLNELYDFTTSSYTNFSITMTHIKNLQEMFTGEIPITYQRHNNHLVPMWGWGTSEAMPGFTLIAEGYIILDPATNPAVFNDMWLKKYCTSLFKRAWSENMSKYENVQLPGGITLNGGKLYDQAIAEIEKLESEMQDKFSLPVEFMIG